MTSSETRINGPKVTIAIPTLNRVAYLRLALESALSQTYQNIEVIVSNNASVDGTRAFLESIDDSRLRILHQPDMLPMTQNWNTCVTAATGDFFLLLSDDDVLEPSAIEKLVAGYGPDSDSEQGPGFVYCGGVIIDAAGVEKKTFVASPERESARHLALAFFSGRRDLWLCAILFRTSDIRPGFSQDFIWAPDSVIWITAVFKRGSAVYIAENLVRYRVHENATASLSLKVWQNELERLGQLAINMDAKYSDGKTAFPSEMEKTIHRLIIRSIPLRINASLHAHKFKALRTYLSLMPTMLTPYGVRFLAMGIFFLFLPVNAKPWLRSIIKGEST